jgi:hypothetical protein
MKNNHLRFFALSLVFLCVAVVFYSQGGVSLGKFLLFLVCGAASGANLIQGIVNWRKGKQDQKG